MFRNRKSENLDDLTPGDFELFVAGWIRKKIGLRRSRALMIKPLAPIAGAGGTYVIDVLVEFTLLDGAEFKVLVECKHLKRPVERDEIQVLEAKLRAVGGHKVRVVKIID
jgi:restriction system protein